MKIFDTPDGDQAIGDIGRGGRVGDYEDVGGEVDGEDRAFDCALRGAGGLDADAGDFDSG